MTTEQMVERVKKLDRLYLAVIEARTAFIATPSGAPSARVHGAALDVFREALSGLPG